MERSWIVRWLRDHPRGADGLLAAAVTTVSLVGHLVGPELAESLDSVEVQAPTWWTVPLVVAATAPIAWRRTAPVISAFVVVLAQCLMELLLVEGTGWLGVLVAVYSLGAHGAEGTRTRAAVGIFGLIGLLLASGLVFDEVGPGVVIATVAVMVSAYLFGDNVRRRRQHLESLAERAERAEREQELLALARVRDERTRLARELHDVVAHSVSVMIIQSGAARRSLPDRPDDAAAMLHQVEHTGRRAMDELRRVLGVLRSADDGTDGAPELVPQPGLAELAELVAADPDLPITLTIDESVSALPEGVAVSVYRLVQESLTNVRRHAGEVRRVDVAVHHHHDLLEVTVSDDGRGAANAAAAQRGSSQVRGFGLAGMRERVVALGGTVTAGPSRGGGWKVHARLPMTALRPPDVAAPTERDPDRAGTRSSPASAVAS